MSDRIATRLLLIARDPVSGRIRNRGAVDKALRGALFADLALAGAVHSLGLAPDVEGTQPTGDRILDSVREAVGRRPGVRWYRWFRQVSVDRVALAGELIGSDHWTRQTGWPARYTDVDPAAALELGVRVASWVAGTAEPHDPSDAILALLAASCGIPEGRPQAKQLATLLPRLLDPHVPAGHPSREAVQNALVNAAAAIRRRRRVLG